MTTLKITKAELLALKPCAPESRNALFARRKAVTVAQALAAGTSIRDVLWVAGKLGRKALCVAFALACAVHVEKLNKTGTAKPCNDATAAYIADPSPQNLEVLQTNRSAAYVASAASASASAASASAAYAASAASASAAYAASAASAAYAAYARKREIAWQKKQLIKIFGG